MEAIHPFPARAASCASPCPAAVSRSLDRGQLSTGAETKWSAPRDANIRREQATSCSSRSPRERVPLASSQPVPAGFVPIRCRVGTCSRSAPNPHLCTEVAPRGSTDRAILTSISFARHVPLANAAQKQRFEQANFALPVRLRVAWQRAMPISAPACAQMASTADFKWPPRLAERRCGMAAVVNFFKLNALLEQRSMPSPSAARESAAGAVRNASG